MSLPTPLPLVTQLASQRWVHAQIFGITAKRLIRLDLVGTVRHAVVTTNGAPSVVVTFTQAFTAASNSDWMTWDPSHPYRLPSPVDRLRLQPIGPHRLAIIAPGTETTTCILFGEDDDGRQEEIFPGFTFGPIDLDRIARTIAAAPNPGPEQSAGAIDA